ncbi:MAG: PD-(D/E)XK nuclease family protein [Candidatus Niyogibacteria bacterium]|nr:MAG: PD-(D/E)XK nuclease family protein [Candidatus Niyogibacteria bacterium]
MRISYSAIDTYKTCPLKYKYSEIDKIKAPKSREAVFGTALHSALRFMFLRDPLYPALDEVINFYREEWARVRERVSWPDAGSEKILNEHGIKILEKFYKKNLPWNFNVLDLESRFELPIKDESTGETHTLSGIIDRIDKPDDETYEIVDYKTGKRLPSQETLDRNLQLSIYHLGLLNRWPHISGKKIRLTLNYLPHGENISTERSLDDLEKTKNSVLETIREIEKRKNKNNDFEPSPSPLCDWCGYKPICPVWRHLYEKDKSSAPDEEKIKEIIAEYFKLKDESKDTSSRVKELQAELADYMRQKNVLRLFGEEGFVSKTIKTVKKYDLVKAEAILRPIGKWQNVLKADEKKLEELLSSLPLDTVGKINEAATIKTSEFLTATRKKIPNPLFPV